MSEVIETTVYRFVELSDSAKETARSWYREGGLIDDWHEFIYEDFERVCDILGLRLKNSHRSPPWRRRPATTLYLVQRFLEPRRRSVF